MNKSKITSIASKLNKAGNLEKAPRNMSLATVCLSIKMFELAGQVNSLIDDIFRITGQSISQLLEDFERDPSNNATDLIIELSPHVLKLESMARDRLEETELGQGA